MLLETCETFPRKLAPVERSLCFSRAGAESGERKGATQRAPTDRSRRERRRQDSRQLRRALHELTLRNGCPERRPERPHVTRDRTGKLPRPAPAHRLDARGERPGGARSASVFLNLLAGAFHVLADAVHGVATRGGETDQCSEKSEKAESLFVHSDATYPRAAGFAIGDPPARGFLFPCSTPAETPEPTECVRAAGAKNSEAARGTGA